MSRKEIFFSKYASEVIAQSMDFVDVLEVGESISSRAVTAQDFAGTDVSGTLISSVAGSGTEITWTLSAGTANTDYYIDVAATLNTSEVHVQRLHLFVETPT